MPSRSPGRSPGSAPTLSTPPQRAPSTSSYRPSEPGSPRAKWHWGVRPPEHAPSRRFKVAGRCAVGDVGVLFEDKVFLIEVELAFRSRRRIGQRFDAWPRLSHKLQSEGLELVGVLYLYGSQLVHELVKSVWEERHDLERASKIRDLFPPIRYPFELRFVDLAQVRERTREAWESRRRPYSSSEWRRRDEDGEEHSD